MLHTVLASVAQPPIHLRIPKTAEIFFTVFSFLAIPGVVTLAIRNLAKDRDPLLLYCLIGGTICALFEPIVDVLGLCYLKSAGAIDTFTIVGRTIPLYLIPVYTWYVGGLSYLFYRLYDTGITTRMVFALWGLGALFNICDETPGLLTNVYTYYGHQPLNIWGLPLWWIFVNPLMPMIAGALIYRLRRHLAGWQLLVVIALVPMADGIGNAAAAWPIWMALNVSNPSYLLTYAAAFLTIALAALCVWIVSVAVARPDHEAAITGLASVRRLVQKPEKMSV